MRRPTILLIAIVGVLLYVAVAVHLSARRQSHAAPPRSVRTMAVDVAWNFALMQVSNVGASDVVGQQMTIYVNGQPPFAYRVNWAVPAVGQTAVIPFTAFVDREGNRFDPHTKAVVEAWIGAAGYDYAAFRK